MISRARVHARARKGTADQGRAQDSRDSTLARGRFFLAKLNFDHLRCDNDAVNEPLNQFSIGNA
jgi:hypothetical protein